MKHLNLFSASTFYLLTFAILFPAAPVSAEEGGAHGGGGNILAAEFSDAAASVLEAASKVRSDILVDGHIVTLDSLKLTLSLAKVTVSDQPLHLDGKAVDAINVPTDLTITFFSGAWKKYSSDERKRLAVHEVLGLAKVRDLSFQASNQLIDFSAQSLPGSDSLWLMCDNESMVLNTFEHRNGVDTRRFDIQMLIGPFVLAGGGETPDKGAMRVRLQTPDGKNHFEGILATNFTDTLSLRGSLTFGEETFAINRKLPCKEKSARALEIK